MTIGSMHELDKVEESYEYVYPSDDLEPTGLTREELDQIIDDIKNNRTQESFLYEVVMAVRRKEEFRRSQLAGEVPCGVRMR